MERPAWKYPVVKIFPNPTDQISNTLVRWAGEDGESVASCTFATYSNTSSLIQIGFFFFFLSAAGVEKFFQQVIEIDRAQQLFSFLYVLLPLQGLLLNW